MAAKLLAFRQSVVKSVGNDTGPRPSATDRSTNLHYETQHRNYLEVVAIDNNDLKNMKW